ncbi:MAG: hypothetical protein Ct9H300mP28_18510 [Pseudomonadota bacterium]|nr:MAG: hypothetical protein Ct9H300mP28_18510 [Pseudomonadota bacterium]
MGRLGWGNLNGWIRSTYCEKEHTDRAFSHNPLYEYYPPWNFWVRDWREVHEIVGHTRMYQYSWSFPPGLITKWKYAFIGCWLHHGHGLIHLKVFQNYKTSCPVDPGDPFDGVGWAKHRYQQNRIE